jgi:hypothetical protein
MKSALFFSILAFALTGCGSQIEDFVRGGTEPAPLTPVAGSNSGKALKVSPGHVDASGTTVRATMTITQTNRLVKGSSVDAKVSLHRGRVQ